MSDDLPPGSDDDAVRRLLADARSSDPMPDDVAARMEAVLADLSSSAVPDAGKPATRSPAEPVVASLSVHRRRRAAGMLVAAAAIVVGGVVVAQHLPSPGGSSAASETAGGADRAGGQALDDQGSSTASPGPGLSPEAGDPDSKAEAKVRAGRVLVRPQHFTADAGAARRLVQRQGARSRYDLSDPAASSCAVAHTGVRVKATYQGAPALLLFHPPAGNAQVVDLYLCGSGRPVRSTTLPSP